jgi:aminoglycoside phosphotransferase (APT) family kinase protein
MRRKPAGKLLPSAHAVDREHRIMTALASTGVPVPRTYGLCEDEGVIGSAFFVMDFVDGRIWWDGTLPGMQPRQRREIYEEMNRVIAALHQVDFKGRGLEAYGKPGNYFERQIGRWSKQYLASVTESNPAMDALLAWLPAHIPASARDEGEVSIVHGDYRMDNVVFHPAEPRIIAVLDWELSTLGHPLADFSYHCMSWHIQNSGAARGLGGKDLAALGIPSERDYVQRYCERTGRADAGAVMADWNFYMAYNMFRIAAIVQGIAKRVEDGTASSAQARETAKSARPLSELAWSFAQKA